MNNLRALEQLEKSAQEQEKRLSNTVQEIHSENLKDLMQTLKATHKQKSENIEKSIQQLEKELKTKYKQYYYQDASFREYGFGATMVTIK